MNPIAIRPSSASRSQHLLSGEEGSSSVNTANTGTGTSTVKGSYLHTLDAQSRQQVFARSAPEDDTSSQGTGGADTGSSATQEGAASVSEAAVTSAIVNDTAGLEAVKSAMKNNLTELASSPEEFHAAMEKSFGASYNKAEAEQIRQQVLDGDFSWMPDIQVVDESVLVDQSGQQTSGTALGAYSKDNDTIYISRQLLDSDPQKATEILTEEVGHGLDARLNTSDAAGDEGDIFSRIVGGEEISEVELTELRAENDSGTIIVDGKEVEVEYGLFSGIKKAFKGIGNAIKGAFKGVGDAITGFVDLAVDVVKDHWDNIKKIGKKILESQLIGQIMMVAQFIPIPIVQLVARGYNLLKAGVAFAQGVKNGSISMMLSGAAGLAGGVSNIGGMLGASQGFVDGAANIANGLNTASSAYSAVAEGNFSQAAQLASNYFGGPDTETGRAFQNASNVYNTIEAVQDGNLSGAISSGAAVYKGFNSGNAETEGSNSSAGEQTETGGTQSTSSPSVFSNLVDNVTGSKTFQAISENVGTIQNIIKTVKDEGVGAAAGMFLVNYGADLGIDSNQAQTIVKWAGVLDQAVEIVDNVKDGDYSAVVGQAADMLGIPLTDANVQQIDTAFQLRESILSDNFVDAARNAAQLSQQAGEVQMAATFTNLADFLDKKIPLPITNAA